MNKNKLDEGKNPEENKKNRQTTGVHMEVVLLQLPFWGVGCPPLGLALLKSYLGQNNISCRIFDVNAQAFCLRGKKFHDYWDMQHGINYSMDEEIVARYYHDNRALFLYYIGEIIKLDPKVVGVSCQGTSLIMNKLFLRDLRKNCPGIKHVMGGPEVAFFMNNAERLLSSGYVDAVSLDEGEKSLLQYVGNITAGIVKPVEGMVLKEQDAIVKGGVATPIKNLNDLPFPDYDDFDFNQYVSNRTLGSYTSRGCINQCMYCTAKNFMKTFRFRSAQRIFEEIVHLRKRYPQIDTIRFCDNISNANIRELDKFCDLLISNNVKVHWNLENAVMRKEMALPLYKKLKKAGCQLIGYGMETSSPALLDKIGKTLSKGLDLSRVLREGKKAGIYMCVNVMFGLPGETENDFNGLLDFLKHNRKYISMINPSITFCEFYPGSDGYQTPEKFGINLKKGSLFWESTDGKNTYPVRMKRFELFCSRSRAYKLDNLIDVEELPNKDVLMFKYYCQSGMLDEAHEAYRRISPEFRTRSIQSIYQAAKKGDSVVENQEEVVNAVPFLQGKTFKETLLKNALADFIQNLEKDDPFKDDFMKPWKKKLRKMFHRIIGYDKIDKKINSVYALVKMVDNKIMFSQKPTDHAGGPYHVKSG